MFVRHAGITERRQGMVCVWIGRGDFAKNCFECINYVCNSSLFLCFFFFFKFYNPGEEGTQTHTESSSQEAEGQTRCQSCTSTFLKLIWRFLIILSVSSSWVGTTQFVKITYETFDCPFFMTWFSTNWNIMVFPIYYSGHLATAQEKQSPIKKIR